MHLERSAQTDNSIQPCQFSLPVLFTHTLFRKFQILRKIVKELELFLLILVVAVDLDSRSHRAATLGNGVHFMQTIGSRSKFDDENDGAD